MDSAHSVTVNSCPYHCTCICSSSIYALAKCKALLPRRKKHVLCLQRNFKNLSNGLEQKRQFAQLMSVKICVRLITGLHHTSLANPRAFIDVVASSQIHLEEEPVSFINRNVCKGMSFYRSYHSKMAR